MKKRNLYLLCLIVLFAFALPVFAQEATETPDATEVVSVPPEATPTPDVVEGPVPNEPTESPRWWDNPLVIQSAITFLALVVVIFTQQSTIRTHIVNVGANASGLVYSLGKDGAIKIVDEIERRAKATPSPDDDLDAAKLRRVVMEVVDEIERRRSGAAVGSLGLNHRETTLG